MEKTFLLKFFGRDELCQMKISKDKNELMRYAKIEYPDITSFFEIQQDLFCIDCNDSVIGVIGVIEELA